MSKQAALPPAWPAELLLRLEEAQSEHGSVSVEAMSRLAASLKIPVNDVYSVASFYSFLSVKPLGRHVIRICKSLPCHYKDYAVVAGAIGEALGIKPGETTPDGRFSFLLTNCIGLCDRAPAMLIDDEPHVALTPQKIARILKQYQ